MADQVDVILALRNVSQFVSGAGEASKAIGGVGDSAEQSGKKASGGWKNMLKWAGGAATIYGATKFIKGAVEQTADLTKNTMALQRATGMDTGTASEWVSLTKERGISAKQLSTGLVKLNKTIETGASGTTKANSTIADLRRQIDAVSAAGGKDAPKQIAKLSAQITKAQLAGEKARSTLSALGVPLDQLQKGDTAAVLGEVADALQKTTNPAERSALAQQLLGRSGQQLLPILMQGREGIAKLLEEQKSYGNYLTDKSIKANQEAIKQQREMETALTGVKTQLGVALLPVMVQVGKILVDLARFMRPVTGNAKLLTIAIVGIVSALVALKTAIILTEHWEAIAKIATMAWTAAQWLLNAALTANPIGLIIVAIVALVAAFVIAYKKVGWFRNAVNSALAAVLSAARAVWSWIKSNWPLLLGILAGPFGIAAAEIITHWKQVKTFIMGVIDAIKQAIAGLVSSITSIPDKIGGVVSKVPGAGVAKSVLGAFAEGGTTQRSGHFLVGERGPEVISLPSGSAVTPLPAAAGFPAGTSAGGSFDVVVPVILDGKVLTRAVARVTTDKLARR